nr:universal stress protein [Natrinema soli]
MTDNILVPVDGSELSDQTVEFAIETHPESSLTFLHVVETPTGPYGEINPNRKNRYSNPLPSIPRKFLTLVARLRRMQRLVVQSKLKPTLANRREKIIEHAEDADIIVMGSHR